MAKLYVAFEFITAVDMKSTVIQDVASRMPADRCRNFGGMSCLHVGRDRSRLLQKVTCTKPLLGYISSKASLKAENVNSTGM